jgi:hypothetical protein
LIFVTRQKSMYSQSKKVLLTKKSLEEHASISRWWRSA